MLNQISILIISSAIKLFTILVLLRLLLQISRADFYNPLSQFIVKVTNPLLKLFRRFIPGFWGFDFASLAILNDGGVVVAYHDSTDPDPLFAVELILPEY